LKHGSELAFLNSCKKILTDFENIAKEAKLKTLHKELTDFLATL